MDAPTTPPPAVTPPTTREPSTVMVPDRLTARFDYRSLAYAAGDPETTRILAERCGVTRRTIHRWKAEGLSVLQADRAAIAMGCHPSVIWPDWFPRPNSPHRRAA